jgi:hypothetical protein
MEHEKPHRAPSHGERERYYDDSDDLAARVRRAKEAAQRQLEAFGDRSEYEVRIIYGQRTDIDYSQPPKPEEHSHRGDAKHFIAEGGRCPIKE